MKGRKDKCKQVYNRAVRTVLSWFCTCKYNYRHEAQGFNLDSVTHAECSFYCNLSKRQKSVLSWRKYNISHKFIYPEDLEYLICFCTWTLILKFVFYVVNFVKWLLIKELITILDCSRGGKNLLNHCKLYAVF